MLLPSSFTDAWPSPAFLSLPPRAGSLVRAVEAVNLQLGGQPFDADSRIVVDALTSCHADGRPATLEAAIVCPRQNIKTWAMERIVLTRLLRPGDARYVVWSAHEVSTSQETFTHIVELAETSRWLRRRLRKISRATGREQITFRVPGESHDRRLRFKARRQTGGRGLAGDGVVFDEAFALTDAHIGSLMPILSTRPRGWLYYGSSAPLATSGTLHRIVRRGRKGAIAYVEYSTPGSMADPGCVQGVKCSHEPGEPGCVMDDESRWLAANLAARHGRITLSYLRQERSGLAPHEFARERLGWPEADVGDTVETIPLDVWDGRKDELSRIEQGNRPVFSVDVKPDMTTVSIGVGGWRADGTVHVGLVRSGLTVNAALDEVARLAKERDPEVVVLDGTSPSAGLVPGLEERGLIRRSRTTPGGQLVVMTANQFGAACSGLRRACLDREVWHRGDPVVRAALEAAERRPIGDGGWGWKRAATDEDITGVVAVTEAHWAVETFVPRDAGAMSIY